MDIEDLRRRLDVALSSRPRLALDQADLISAAVLLPIIDRGGPHILFTKKSEAVPHHKGQFSFPGGVVQHTDSSVVEAALREAWEEVGLEASLVEVLGLFDDVATAVTNFVITPVLGLARGEPTFRPDGREIERVIEIPLIHLLRPGAFRVEDWEREGVRREVVFVDYGEDVVWGTTGRILRELLDALFPETALPPRAG